MSTLTSDAKFKVTGLFKAAYRWLRDEPQPFYPKQTSTPPPASKPPTKPGPPRSTIPAAAASDTLQLPLQPILDTLPLELKAKLRQQNVGVMTFPLLVSKVMVQLPHGTVKIPFGELRAAAPGVFLLTTDCDHLLVTLPLNDVLRQISVNRLTRRADQKVVEVPEDITSPFGEDGKGIVIASTKDKLIAPTPSTRVTPSPASEQPVAFQRTITPAPTTPTVDHPPKAAPVPPPKPSAAFPLPKAATTSAAGPLAVPTPASPPKPVGGNGQPSSSPLAPAFPKTRQTERQTDPVAFVSERAGDHSLLQIPLLNLMDAWPQTVRLEIAQLNSFDAKVVVPIPVLEKGLRLGKVEFPWKLVRAWIRPEVPPQVSPNDTVAVPFPLSVIAPLFVAQRRPAAARQRRVAVDETIPNLFFGFPQGDGSPGMGHAAPVTAPISTRAPDTNFYALRDYEPEASAGELPAAGTAPATDFMRRYTPPNELVARAVSLDGVAGALVALPDGLAVASRVPPNFNSDTLAAFLPQIFSKISQCTQELRMGTLNNVNFTVGNVPWKIFRVNNVFFAAFGRAEEALPTAQLAALAAELDRKPKAA